MTQPKRGGNYQDWCVVVALFGWLAIPLNIIGHFIAPHPFTWGTVWFAVFVAIGATTAAVLAGKSP